jgi:hypothetical protein
MNVLKKTAAIAALAAAALLSASPLALADDKDHHDGHKTIIKQEGDGGNNACKNQQKGDFDAEGGNSFLGLIPLVNGNNVLDNVNALQCVNILNNNLNENEVFVAVLGDNLRDGQEPVAAANDDD